jgi:geranylgeranyl pyrophosphate synthase
MDNYFDIINNFINTKYINNFPIEIHDKIKYLFNDGKKIRPILSLCFGSIENGNDYGNENEIILNLYVSIELIHCLSLIIDDLPEMDNDFERRSKKAFHIKYGNEYTNFFIYYMLNKLFIILNNGLDNGLDKEIIELNIRYARDIMYLFKLNVNNLIDGQYIDMEFNKQLTNISSNSGENSKNHFSIYSSNIDSLYEIIIEVIFSFLEDINIDTNIDNNLTTLEIIDTRIYENIILSLKKTGALFALSTNIGYLLQLWMRKIDYTDTELDKTNSIVDSADVADNIFDIVSVWGYMFGYVFQISDDILDYEKDKEQNKPNICIILGKDNTIILFNNCCQWLRNILKTINEKSLQLWKIFYIDIDTINQIIDIIDKRIL